jgi:hypothetical protein
MKTSRSSLIKLALGLGLILASVIGVTALVSSMSKTRGMVLAATDMPVGHVITAGDLIRTDGYVVGSRVVFPDSIDALLGKVTTRPLALGEVISEAVVTSSFDLDVTTLVLTVNDGVPAALAPGDTIEVWSAGMRDSLGMGFGSGTGLDAGGMTDSGATDSGAGDSGAADSSSGTGSGMWTPGQPRPLAAGEFVARIGDAQSAALGGSVQVEVLVAKSDVSAILSAQTRGEALVVLPERSSGS